MSNIVNFCFTIKLGSGKYEELVEERANGQQTCPCTNWYE
jgi:hypothetical protein